MNKELEIAVRIVNEHPSMKGKSVDEVLKKVKEVYSYLVGLQDSGGLEREDKSDNGVDVSAQSFSEMEENEVYLNDDDDDDDDDFNEDSLDVFKNLRAVSRHT